MTTTYVAQLGLKVQKSNIIAQKINKSSLEIYSMVIIVFQVLHKPRSSLFF